MQNPFHDRHVDRSEVPSEGLKNRREGKAVKKTTRVTTAKKAQPPRTQRRGKSDNDK